VRGHSCGEASGAETTERPRRESTLTGRRILRGCQASPLVSSRENNADVGTLIPPEEFAALVGVSAEQVEQWRQQRLLDPGVSRNLEELDLLRWLTIHSYEARGYSSDQLAAEIKSGDTHPFLGEFLFPSGPTLSVDEAAERADVDVGLLRELRTALGLSQDGIAESWLGQVEAFKTMQAAGLPWEAVLEGARVVGDTLRRLAETEVRLVHVHIHERLSASGMPEDEGDPPDRRHRRGGRAAAGRHRAARGTTSICCRRASRTSTCIFPPARSPPSAVRWRPRSSSSTLSPSPNLRTPRAMRWQWRR